MTTPTLGNSIDFAAADTEKHVQFLLDLSTSMRGGGKLASLNTALQACTCALVELQQAHPTRIIKVRRYGFPPGSWIDPEPIPVSEFTPSDLTIKESGTPIAKAVRDLVAYLNSKSGEGQLSPAALLVSDGQPTDDFHAEIEKAKENPAFFKADRMAIAIGADADEECLKKFLSPNAPLLRADNADQLVKQMVMASRMLATGQPSAIAGKPESMPEFDGGGNDLGWSIDWA